ncbi:Nephronectin Preosteoblast EGF-like repeat protein with MAM domain [Triplophysa tibetana]|uniref:Nephronectin Preosteoblast EGF-like repeat protein with MAM domain n=1 Tax=Triplophysa tibetana TaxID=1572043 RepID=A0A5A9PJL4_9TELE|nr:Nephronectin Preosteoblast EGF-like repeat protein with MAM domain [Triplophysa tibetana]
MENVWEPTSASVIQVLQEKHVTKGCKLFKVLGYAEDPHAAWIYFQSGANESAGFMLRVWPVNLAVYLTILRYLNECGLKPRPCKHRCMNTYGSYKCYCLNGYMLLPDGSCGNARTCGMANCQYGCEVMKGEVRCQCPSPGLQLAPDGRTCVDVDECATGHAVCPRFRKCINTFGSYICKCHDGFDLQYINGKYQCTDVNECSSGQHQCSPYATCYNTPGSYKCKCKDNYRGMGFDCKPIPKVVIDPPRPGNNNKGGNKIPDSDHKRPTTTNRPPVTAKRISATTTTTRTPPTKKIPTAITHRPLIPTRRPPVLVTPKPKIPTRLPPTTITTKAPVVTAMVPIIPTPRPAITPVTPVDNSIKDNAQKQRGDVHKGDTRGQIFRKAIWIRKPLIQLTTHNENRTHTLRVPRNHGQNNVFGIDIDIELGNTEEEVKDDPGGRYLTISEGGEKRGGRGAQLILPLTPPWNEGNLCLAFRHKMAGHHVGMLQVFVQKGRQHSPAVWGRTGGNGWRSTQITIWGNGLESIIVKGERRRGRTGEITLDDMSLRKGSCQEEHNLRRL